MSFCDGYGSFLTDFCACVPSAQWRQGFGFAARLINASREVVSCCHGKQRTDRSTVGPTRKGAHTLNASIFCCAVFGWRLWRFLDDDADAAAALPADIWCLSSAQPFGKSEQKAINQLVPEKKSKNIFFVLYRAALAGNRPNVKKDIATECCADFRHLALVYTEVEERQLFLLLCSH